MVLALAIFLFRAGSVAYLFTLFLSSSNSYISPILYIFIIDIIVIYNISNETSLQYFILRIVGKPMKVKEILSAKLSLENSLKKQQELLHAYELVLNDLHAKKGGNKIKLPAVIEEAVEESKPKKGRKVSKRGYGRNTKLVREAVENQSGVFTFREILSTLAAHKKKLKPTAVTVVLNRLVKLGDLKIAEAGSGRRAVKYKV